MTRVELKEKAKKSLQNKWKVCVLAILSYILITFGIGFIAGIIMQIARLNEDTINCISNILNICVSSFFIISISSFFLNVARGNDVRVSDIFSKSNMFGSALLTTILISIFTTLWTLLLIIPGIIAALKYSQAFYIMADDHSITGMDAINKSKEIMNGHKMDFFVLNLSFIGWVILACFTLGIGFLWLVPYMYTTEAHFYDSIKK